MPKKGYKQTQDHRRKIGEGNKGIVRSEEIKEKISKATEGKNNPFYGHRHTEEAKEKNREAHLGNIPTNKGKKHTKEAKRKMKGRKLTEDHIKKVMKRRIPTSLEDKFIGIIDRYSLPYAYVGDGSFILENCNPDFINIDGKKIAVEVYCRFYKQLGNGSIKDWKKKRINVFKKYGWRIFFFDEIALNKEENVLKVLEY